jgi:hypothetical protein
VSNKTLAAAAIAREDKIILTCKDILNVLCVIEIIIARDGSDSKS